MFEIQIATFRFLKLTAYAGMYFQETILTLHIISRKVWLDEQIRYCFLLDFPFQISLFLPTSYEGYIHP